MKLELEIQGEEALRLSLEEYGKRMSKKVERTINVWTLNLHRMIIKEIQTGSKSGIVYKRKKGTHQASAEGQAPATDTGELVGGIFPKLLNSAARIELSFTFCFQRWSAALAFWLNE